MPCVHPQEKETPLFVALKSRQAECAQACLAAGAAASSVCRVGCCVAPEVCCLCEFVRRFFMDMQAGLLCGPRGQPSCLSGGPIHGRVWTMVGRILA